MVAVLEDAAAVLAPEHRRSLKTAGRSARRLVRLPDALLLVEEAADPARRAVGPDPLPPAYERVTPRPSGPAGPI
jgi:hypothetical protein